jgi:hypothetical protein
MVTISNHSRKFKEHVFKEREPLKNKIVANWIEEEKMKKTFVEIIQQV